MDKENLKVELNILKHVEDLSNRVNRMMASRTKGAFHKYPLTFGLLILAGIVAVSEGMRGVIESFGIFQDHPWYLLIIGLLILTITGRLYVKLEEKNLE